MDSAEMKKSRTTSKRLFTRANKSLKTAIDNDIQDADEHDSEIIEKRLAELHQRYQDAQEKHEMYMSEIEGNVGIDEKWRMLG